MKKFIYIAILLIVSGLSVTSCTEQEIKPRDGGSGGTAPDPKGWFTKTSIAMKTKIIFALIVSAVLVSLGATRITKAPVKNTDMQASASPAGATLGGFAAEDR
jgi:hypothetical protein